MIKTHQNKPYGNPSFRNFLFACLTGLFIFVLFPKGGFSQVNPNLIKTDSITFALYEKQQWDELIEFGETAIKSGMDFYYLRMRIAIALYEKHNYRRAIPHFEKAIQFFPGDQLALEYLYYSYLFAGRSSDSRSLLPHLTEATKTKMGLSKSILLDEIYFEGGPAISDISKLKENWKNPNPSDSIYSSTTYFKGYNYFHGGIRLNVLPNLSVYQGYGRIDASAQQNIRDFDNEYEPYTRIARQNEYYANLEVALPKGFKITGAGHFLWQKYNKRAAFYDSLDNIHFDTTTYKIDDYVLSLLLLKEFSFGAINLSGTFGNFSSEEVKQLGASLIYYPFGNINLYSITGLINLWDKNGYRSIFTQEIGGRIYKNLWFEGSATFGSLRNYSENNAFVVYNAPEDIDNKYEATFIFAARKHLELSVRYRYLVRESGYLSYENDDNYDITKTKYPFHSIIGGIKWKL